MLNKETYDTPLYPYESEGFSFDDDFDPFRASIPRRCSSQHRAVRRRKKSHRFRNFLLKDGYHMLQYSVYARVCNGTDAVEKHRRRIRQNLPDNGSIRMLVITEKQYESIEILIGKLTQADESFQCEQLSIF